EDGRLTDAQGRTVDFRNTIVIMTSNIGAKDIARNVSFGFGTSDETGTSYEDLKDRIMGELKKVFRPEFLNRVDEVMVFHKLTKDEIKEIVDLLISRVRAQVAEHELQLELSDEAKELLADKGWDPAMGARPLRRAIQRYVEDPLADEVLRSGPEDIVPGTTVLVERNPEGDAEDQPLKMTLIKPTQRRERKKEPVGVGAKKEGGEERSAPGGAPGARVARARPRGATSPRGAARIASCSRSPVPWPRSASLTRSTRPRSLPGSCSRPAGRAAWPSSLPRSSA